VLDRGRPKFNTVADPIAGRIDRVSSAFIESRQYPDIRYRVGRGGRRNGVSLDTTEEDQGHRETFNYHKVAFRSREVRSSLSFAVLTAREPSIERNPIQAFCRERG
jgi:hypothetical protein